MIAVDSSAVISVLLGETAAEMVLAALEAADARVVSLLSVLESTMAMSRAVSQPQSVVDGFLLEAKIDSYPFDSVQAQWARHAFLTYGKGRHPARLNFGDCISYALARSLEVPLLYTGDDFAKTDVIAA